MRQAEAGVDLESSVGYRVKETSSALHTAMEEALRPLGLNITQYSALELLAQRPGLSSSDLARGTFVTRQSMAVVMQNLTGAGLVSRPETAEHGRVLPVRLTPSGEERRRAASTAVRGVELRMLSGFGDAEVAVLRRLLERCTDALRTDAEAGTRGA